LGEKLIEYVKTKKQKITTFISGVLSADDLTIEEKSDLINGCAYQYNEVIAAVNKKNDMDLPFINDNYDSLLSCNRDMFIQQGDYIKSSQEEM
jgi:hypothetical protein